MPFERRRYPDDWEAISHYIRFVRACGMCQWCSRVHGWMLPSGWPCVLTVAHLDHDVDNMDWDNLVALCQPCHLRHDAGLHARHRRYGRGCDEDHQLRLDLAA